MLNLQFQWKFRSFILHSFNSSEAGRKTVSDDHFVGSDKIMQKTITEYVYTVYCEYELVMAGGFL